MEVLLHASRGTQRARDLGCAPLHQRSVRCLRRIVPWHGVVSLQVFVKQNLPLVQFNNGISSLRCNKNACFSLEWLKVAAHYTVHHGIEQVSHQHLSLLHSSRASKQLHLCLIRNCSQPFERCSGKHGYVGIDSSIHSVTHVLQCVIIWIIFQNGVKLHTGRTQRSTHPFESLKRVVWEELHNGLPQQARL